MHLEESELARKPGLGREGNAPGQTGVRTLSRFRCAPHMVTVALGLRPGNYGSPPEALAFGYQIWKAASDMAKGGRQNQAVRCLLLHGMF